MKRVSIIPPLHYYQLAVFWIFSFAFSQNPSSMPLTPAGVLDQLFDRYGKDYQMLQIHIPSTNVISEEETTVFKLYFELGCGMEDSNDDAHIQRRKVLLTVLTDLESFLGFKSVQNKVNIWVRAINQASSTHDLRLGLGTSLYNVLEDNTGSIADGEVWKSLLSDINSYTNVVRSPNDFYHGVLAFNFSNYDGRVIKWHTDLNTSPGSRDYDLYSVMLKEALHLLGVTSLMNAQGTSVFGLNYKYFSRFDTKLRNQSNKYALIKNSGSVFSYNWTFNTDLPLSVLRPGCNLPDHTNPNIADNSLCANALKYVGRVKLPIYTPTCFEVGNSLSSFEDELFPHCLMPYGNNSYFVMSNRNNLGTLKRYPKPEERLVLADLGYSLDSVYGQESTYLGYYEYDQPLGNSEVVGVNDGINATNNTYSYVTNIGVPISISGQEILGNDYGSPTIIAGLVNTTVNSGTVSMSSGNITFTPNTTFFGQVTLTYVPQSVLGQEGGVTEIYIYVLRPDIDNLPPFVCDYITNGQFENNSGYPTNYSQFNLVNFWSDYESTTPEYFHASAPNPNVGVPNNFYNPSTVPDNVTGNIAYGGFFISTITSIGFRGESLWTPLLQMLTSGQAYTLRFDVRKANYSGNVSFKMQALFTSELVPPTPFHQFPAEFAEAEDNQLLTSENVTSINNEWETIEFNFTASGKHKYLYLGSLFQTDSPMGESFYYIDNVSLVSVTANDDSFAFSPSTITQTSTISILQNDDAQSSAPDYLGITITQVGDVLPAPAIGGITVNATGQVVVAPSTPIGTYTLQYYFTGSCGASNVATVTVDIALIESSGPIYHPGKCTGPPICNLPIFQTTDSPLSQNTTWLEGTHPEPAYIFNPVPNPNGNGSFVLGTAAVLGQLEFLFVPAPQPGVQSGYPATMPSFLTLNPDGSLTVAPNTPAQPYHFLMKACETGNPSNCTDPIRVDGKISDQIEAASYNVYVSQSTGLAYIDSYQPIPNQSGFYSGPMNVLEESKLCGQQATTSNVTITQLGAVDNWLLDETIGDIVNPAQNFVLGEVVLNYQICVTGANPPVCSTGAITIIVVP